MKSRTPYHTGIRLLGCNLHKIETSRKPSIPFCMLGNDAVRSAFHFVGVRLTDELYGTIVD